jgi:foldase protein PrsA
MSKARRYALALGAFFVLALALAACGSDVPGNSVADVAGNPITVRAYDHWMYVAEKGNSAQSPGSPVIVPDDPPGFANCITQARAQIPSLRKTPVKTLRSDCQQLFTSLNSQVMSFLITSYWYQLEANRLHIHLTDAQLMAMFNSQRKQAFPTTAAYRAFLKETGQTQADVLFRVRVQALLSKLEALHRPRVTSAAITAYYHSHAAQFGSPQTRDVEFVLTKTSAQAASAKSALATGQSWCSVAKRYSIDAATKDSCGKLSGVTNGQEVRGFNAAIFSAPKGRLEGPIHTPFGYYVFEVTSITPATHESLASATPSIRAILQSQASSEAASAVQTLTSRAWKSQTHCVATYAISDCAGYRPPKTTATPLPSTTTSAPSKKKSKK